MNNLIKDQLKHLTELCRKFHVGKLELFGSALGMDRFDIEKSDIDFLVEFQPMEASAHAKAYFGLLEALMNLFGRNVDLVETKAIKNPYLLNSINQSRQVLYAC